MPSTALSPDATHPINTGNRPSFISDQHTEGDYYFLDLNPSKASPLTIVCGGIETCAPGYKIDRQNFRYYGIEYIASGQCEITLDGVSHTLSAGSIYCYEPNVAHTIENKCSEPLIKYFIDFCGTQSDQLINDGFGATSRVYRLPHLSWLRDVFSQFQDCQRINPANAQPIYGHLLQYLLSRVKQSCVIAEETTNPSFATYQRCRMRLETSYCRLKSITELAQESNITPPHLCRLFRRYCGETPSEMLNRLKMNRAADLLTNGNLLVKEVAYDIGMDDPYYFSHAFKKHFGTAPSEFAKSIRN